MRRRASTLAARLAMQKVDGSSPFIRFTERPAKRIVSLAVQEVGGSQGLS
jgi:hypothetical protein